MFERRFKEIILSFLGEFIEDFDSSELRVDSWSGQVTQSHLKLKPSALRFLCLMTGLNIEVVRGVIGSLQINFNWRTLWREPIRLTLEDLHILCHPLPQSDPTIFRDRARKQKRSKLEDMLQRRNLENPRKTYWKQLENTISDNIIVSLKNVHIRYEDPISNPAAPFALGLTLEKLVLQPCDSHWIKSFITLEQKKAIQKSFTVLELGEFAIYHIAKANELFVNKRDWLMSLSHDKFVTLMYQYIAHTKYLPHIAEYYLLRPVNAEIKIRKSLKPPEQSEIPKTTMSIVVEEIAFSLEENQYHDLLMLGSFISLNNTLGEEGQFRPSCRPHDNPRLWWKYAYQVISSRLNKKRAPHRKLYLSIRKVDKEEYMKLYKHKLIREYEEEFERKIGGFEKEARLANAKPELLDSLLLKIEDRHTMEEIFLFRTMAERDLYWSLDSPKKKGWIEWGRSWFFSNSHNEEEEGYLKALLDYSEMISDVSQAPGNFVKSFINFELKRCSISLAARQLNGLLASFLKITLDKAIIQKRATKAASHTYAALCSIKVTDPFTPFQKFSHLLHTKNAKELGSVTYEIEEEYFPDDNDGFSEFSKNNFNHTPVFEMTMGNENKDAMSLKVNMEPLEVIYNKHCIERIKRFFRVPEALALYEIIEIQTLNQYSSWKHRTQAKLEYILKKHMNIKLDIHISAPVIIIPLNPMNEDTTQMILDLGLLQVKSKTQDETLDWTSIRKNSVDTDESEFYDHFDVKVSDINVMLLPPDSLQSWHIVEKFDINLSVSKCIIPKDPHLTTFRIKGRIDSLTAKVSKLQFMILKQYSKDTSISSSLSSSMISEEMQFKPPKVMSESEEDEFYDVVDPYSDIVEDLAETAYTFPSFKEHLALEFSINDFNIIILEDRDAEEEEKQLLIFTATGLQAQASLEESRKRAGVKLRGIKVEDSLQSPRILVESNEELADLVIIEVCTYLESHPEFSSQQFHTQVTANLNHLQINYHDGNTYLDPIAFILSLIQPRQAPSLPELSNPSLLASISIRDISLKLNDGVTDLTLIQLGNADFKYSVSQFKSLKCRLGGISITDCESRIRFLEGVHEDLLKIDYKTEDVSALNVNLRSFKVVILMDMCLSLLNFAYKSSVMEYMRKRKRKENKVSKAPMNMVLNLDCVHPLLEFFVDQESSDVCIVDLGMTSLYIDNEKTAANVQGLQIYTIQNEDKDVLIDEFEMRAEANLPFVALKVARLVVVSNESQLNFLKKLGSSYSNQLLKIQDFISHFNPKKKQSSSKLEIKQDEASANLYTKVPPLDLSLRGEFLNVDLTWHVSEQELLQAKLKRCSIEMTNRGYIWMKVNIDWASMIMKTTLYQEIILLPHNESEPMFEVTYQKDAAYRNIDIIINNLRLILTPQILRNLLKLKVLSPKRNRRGNTYNASLCLNNFQLFIGEDYFTSIIDEEDLHDCPTSLEQDSRTFTVIQFSLQFIESALDIKNASVFMTRGAHLYSMSDNMKTVIHPFDAEFKIDKETYGAITEIDVDLSIAHCYQLADLAKEFKKSLPSSDKKKELNIQSCNLKLDNLLVSISHDFTGLKGSTYFILQLDSIYTKLLPHKEFSTNLSMYYFNQQLLDWEPFIEKCNINLQYDSAQKHLAVRSSKEFNLNLSSSFIHAAGHFMKGVSRNELYSSKLRTPTLIRWGSGYWIKNETGQSVKYWVGKKVLELNHNEEHPLDFGDESEEMGSAVGRFKHKLGVPKIYNLKTVTIQIGDMPRIDEVCLDRLGCQVLTVPSSHFQVLCEVTSKHGDKILIVRSSIQIRNNLTVPISLRLVIPLAQYSKITDEDYFTVITAPPSTTIPLPITSSFFYSLQIRVAGYSWSDRIDLAAMDESLVIECRHKGHGMVGNLSDIWNSKKKEAASEAKSAYVVLRTSLIEMKDDTERFFVKFMNFDPSFILENLLCCPVEFRSSLVDRKLSDEMMQEFRKSGVLSLSSIKSTGILDRNESFEWLNIHPNDTIDMHLKILGYDWTPKTVIHENENLHVIEFRSVYEDTITIFLSISRENSIFKVTAYAQYWLENLSGLPIMFQYIENNVHFMPVSLPSNVEGVMILPEKKKGFEESAIISAFGNTICEEIEELKPWLMYQEESKTGLGALIDQKPSESQISRMFSSSSMYISDSFACVRIANSEWSEAFKLEASETSSVISMSGQSIKAVEQDSPFRQSCLYEIAITLQLTQISNLHTKILRFSPRFVLQNKIDRIMLISQFEPTEAVACRLLSHETSNFHWPDWRRSKNLCIKFEEYGWEWSGQFAIEEPDDFILRLRNRYNHEEMLVHVIITLEEATLHVIFKDTTYDPPYRIENLSFETITLFQIPEHQKILQPYEITAYAWDEPHLNKLLTLNICGKSASQSIPIGSFKLDAIMKTESIFLKKHNGHPDHFLYVDIITDGFTKVLTIRHQQIESEDRIQRTGNDAEEHFKVSIGLSHLGLSVVNSVPQELLYITLEGLKLTLSRDNQDMRVDFSIKNLQIDNQLYRTHCPVLLHTMADTQPTNFLRIRVQKRISTLSDQETEYYKKLSVSICPIDIKMDWLIMESLISMISEAVEMISPIGSKPLFSSSTSTSEKQKTVRYYFDKLHIKRMVVNLTFSSIPSMFKNLNMINLVRMFFIIISNIGNVCLDFNSLKLTHRHLTIDLLQKELLSFYLAQCKKQALNILGSSDVIGNPNEFIRHIRMGVKDLFTFTGQFTVTGLLRGFSSLFKHVTFGASNSTSKFFESIRKGLHSIYVDERHDQGKIWKLTMALARTSLLLPNIMVSLASSTATNLRDALQTQQNVTRKRPPRSFLTSRLLTPYSYNDSVGQYVLSIVESGVYLSEGIRDHISLSDMVIVVTSQRILCAEVEQKTASWQVSLKWITLVKVLEDAEALVIFYTNPNTPGFYQEKVTIRGPVSELYQLASTLVAMTNG